MRGFYMVIIRSMKKWTKEPKCHWLHFSCAQFYRAINFKIYYDIWWRTSPSIWPETESEVSKNGRSLVFTFNYRIDNFGKLSIFIIGRSSLSNKNCYWSMHYSLKYNFRSFLNFLYKKHTQKCSSVSNWKVIHHHNKIGINSPTQVIVELFRGHIL